jgi:dTDP-4-dehydrorhamnose 3,5-epimerase
MIFPEVKTYEPDSFKDHRGELWTVYNDEDHYLKFNHDKVAISWYNVFRGFHGDNKSYKLITCLEGIIKLYIVDYRSFSPNYLKVDTLILSEANRIQVLVPPMFANGHHVLTDKATFFYKWAYPGKYPDVDDQFSIKWNDPRLNIEWNKTPILSERDK